MTPLIVAGLGEYGVAFEAEKTSDSEGRDCRCDVSFSDAMMRVSGGGPIPSIDPAAGEGRGRDCG